jgi:hypothetical protein
VKQRRTLALRAERLVALTDDDLGRVDGGATVSVATAACISGVLCIPPSRLVGSVCECVTNFCSGGAC